MKVTIAIPTHNRALTLRQTLSGVGNLKLPDGVEAECLVVDNRSTDDTAQVVAEFAAKAQIRTWRVVEQRLGSSFARNRAIGEAAGEMILFIDDDVVVDPSWAAEMLGEIARRELDVCCGMVVPRWPQEIPRWLGTQLYVKLAVHDPSPEIPHDARETIASYFSANAGFRRECFARFGKFREDLGVVGGNPISGEDTDLFLRILSGGGRVGFADRAVVEHLISPERLSRAYFRRKSFAFGVGTALKGGPSHNRPGKLVKNLARMGIAAARGDSAQAFYHQLEIANFLGYWRGRLMRSDAPIPRPS